MSKIDEYKRLLATMDWYYVYSDDHSVWARGRDQMKKLIDLQKEIDPDRKIWNQFCR